MNRRLRILLIALNICTLLALLLSWNLWTGIHSFPKIPLFELLNFKSNALDLGLVGLLLIGLVSSMFFSKTRLPLLLILASILSLILLDINRLQVWVFHFFLAYSILLSLAKSNKVLGSELLIFSSMQVLTLSMYLWTGINKLNASFFENVAPYIAAPLMHKFTSFIYFDNIIMIAPFLGLSFIPLLMIQKTRSVALLSIMIYHGVAIFLVGFAGYNSNDIIIPWNLFILASAFILFGNTHGFQPKFVRIFDKPNLIGPLLLAGLFPILSHFGNYPYNMSWDVYSGRIPYEHLKLSTLNVETVPSYLDEFTTSYGGFIYIDTYSWAMKELNTPPFNHPWVDQEIAEKSRELLKVRLR